MGSVQRFGYRLTDKSSRHLSETCFPIRHPGREAMLVGSIVEDVTEDVRVNVYAVGPVACDLDQLAAQGGSSLTVKRFETVAAFANVADVLAPGCVLVANDALLPQLVAHAGERLPTVTLGGTLAAPFTPDRIEAAIRAATTRTPPPEPAPHDSEEALARLSRREGEVLDGLLHGGTNKTIARDLGLSPRTVELHRARLMDRLKVRTLSELLRLALKVSR